MTREANILILCANQKSIRQEKCIKIVESFCNETTYIPGCKYWDIINFYYSGLELSKISDIPKDKIVQINNRSITISHHILPDEVGNIKNHLLPAYIEHVLQKNIHFFDLIINENCPRSPQSSWAIEPKDLNSLILNCLKLDGFYIDKSGAGNIFGNAGFQVLYDPNNTQEGILKKLEPPINIDIEKIEGTLWSAYKLRTELTDSGSIRTARGIKGKSIKRNNKKSKKKSVKKRKIKRKKH